MLKYFVNTSLPLLLIVFACRSFSEPVLYEFRANLSSEISQTSPYVVNKIIGRFVYDSDGKPSKTNVDSFGSGFGRYSYYEDTVVNLTFNLASIVLGPEYSAVGANLLICDTDGTDDAGGLTKDGFFINAGVSAGIENQYPINTSPLAEYEVSDITVFGWGGSDFYGSEALPHTLSSGSGNNGVNITLSTETGTEELRFWDSMEIYVLGTDSDRDLILDSLDQCPNSSFGTTVDDEGCTAAQLSEDTPGTTLPENSSGDSSSGGGDSGGGSSDWLLLLMLVGIFSLRAARTRYS